MTASSIDRHTASALMSLELSGPAALPRVTVTGEIDCTSAPELRTLLDQLITAAPAEIVVDLTGVTFLDSAGLCVLAATHRQAVAGGGRLRVLAASRAVVRPLQITGLWQLLQGEQVGAVAS